MKKSLIAVAVLGAFAGVASAQSSVTLFGIVDLSANYSKNGSTSLSSMDSNQLNSNRLGFRGTEDLGGGLTAGFWLEGGMANDTGVGSSTGAAGVATGGFDFKRRSTLSLTSAKLGEIRLGRDYTNTFLTAATYDAYGANGFGSVVNLYASSVAGLGSGATTAVRANNMIGYFLPGNLGGVYGSVQTAAGQGSTGNKYRGGRLGWAAGPIDVSASYSQTDVAAANLYKVANIGASYDLGVVKLIGLLDQRKFGDLKYNIYSFSASVPLGQGEFRAAYSSGNAKGGAIDANDAKLIGLEYIYNLSKRTALYTQYGRLENKGKSNIQLIGVTTDAAITNGGFTSTGYGVGVRHSF